MAVDPTQALNRFILENNIQTVDADQIYKFDGKDYQAFLQSKPWAKEYVWFSSCCDLPLLR